MDAKRQVQQLNSILYSSYGACVLPDPQNPDVPFVADAIVANPPAYGEWRAGWEKTGRGKGQKGGALE